MPATYEYASLEYWPNPNRDVALLFTEDGEAEIPCDRGLIGALNRAGARGWRVQGEQFHHAGTHRCRKHDIAGGFWKIRLERRTDLP